MTARRSVTVVVPVYGDLPGLLRCISALITTIDQTRDSVLLVNDCGPDADEIERAVLAAIDIQPAFRYERNPRNLGFVGNCNRAALELSDRSTDVLLLNSDAEPAEGWLDEMTSVLADNDETGIVCARSDNATIATIPFRRRHPGVPGSRERTAEVHAAVRDRMPASSVVPVAMGFCFLIRRELLDRFGLFDPEFAPGYGEENDFCLRMADHGWHSRMAHRALVFHEGGQSFLSHDRARLRAKHELKLMRRHPHYSGETQAYLRRRIDPVDVFADAYAPADETRRILVELGDEVTETVLNELRAGISDARVAGFELAVTIGTTPTGRARAAAAPGFSVAVGEVGNRIWDVAIARSEAAARTNAFCLRAPRSVVAPASLSAAVVDAARAATEPIDDDALRARWATLRPEWDAAAGTPSIPPATLLRLRLDAIDPRIRRVLERLVRGAGKASGRARAVRTRA